MKMIQNGKYVGIVILLWTMAQLTQAQSTTYAPLRDDNHHIAERIDILGQDTLIHTAIKPYRRSDLYYLGVNNKYEIPTQHEFFLLEDNNDWDGTILSGKSILKHFYRSPAHLLEVRTKDFYMNVNPIIHFKAGLERYNGDNNFVFLNRRGAVIRGNIAEKVFFYTDIIESQARFATYLSNRIDSSSAIPGAGFYKQYDSRLTPLPNDGFDYLLAQGYIGFNIIPQIGVQLGHGRNFIGDGHRSLFLSDFSNNYFYLKLNTRVWHFHYQNIYAELIQDYERGGDRVLPKKYMAAHYLSWKVFNKPKLGALTIGFWEATIFSRDNGGFELQYLNPIIFYRGLEQALGSPDNVMIGLSWKYNFLQRFSFYGQFVLDEFSFNRLFPDDPSERGWWANKHGLQIGLKYLNIGGIKNLDAQIEFNTVRPYTYTFRDSSANFSHYNQPLAHPMGANFREFTTIVRYEPIANLTLRAQMTMATYGLDTMGSNWGTNVHLPYGTYEQEFGNQIGQGIKTQLFIADFWASYQFKRGIYADFQYRFRRENASLDAWDNQSHIITLGLRWNIAERLEDF